MSDTIVFEILKLIVMVGAVVLIRYVVPWLKTIVSANDLAEIERWVKYAVLKAQQVMYAESGEDRKAYVTEFLKRLLLAKNIALSDEQLDILIEAAVKQMKIESGGN